MKWDHPLVKAGLWILGAFLIYHLVVGSVLGEFCRATSSGDGRLRDGWGCQLHSRLFGASTSQTAPAALYNPSPVYAPPPGPPAPLYTGNGAVRGPGSGYGEVPDYRRAHPGPGRATAPACPPGFNLEGGRCARHGVEEAPCPPPGVRVPGGCVTRQYH
ncbi:MAG: hypothetical protein AAB421_04810 [Patescibacteria group bacterium]